MFITPRRIALGLAVVGMYFLTLDALLSFPLLYTLEHTLITANIPTTTSLVVSRIVWIMPLIVSISLYLYPPTLYMGVEEVR